MIKAFDAYDLDIFLTVIMDLKLGETTKLKLMEHSNDSQWRRNRSGCSGFGRTTFHGEKLKLRIIVNNYLLIIVMFV